MRRGRTLLLAVAGLLSAAGCGEDREALTVYAAVDRETAAPVLAAFERETGLRVRAVHDSEALKTVGLAERLRREKERPTADVWWSGETLHTARLAAAGCFEPIDPVERAGAAPAREWLEFAGRLRVLVYRKDTWPLETPPEDLAVLADPRLRGKAIVARPTVGTSATHAAALAATPEGRALLDAIARNDVMVVAGNAHVVTAVRKGQALVGLTDSDDARIGCALDPTLAFEVARHVLPGTGNEGAVVVIPSSVAVVAGARHGDLARRFARFVAGPQGEALLAASPAGHLPLEPLGPCATRPTGLPAASDLPPRLLVDHAALVEDWSALAPVLEERFAR